MSDTKKTREIDLFDLFASIGRGIKNIFVGLFDAAMWGLFFAIKKYKILLIFFALGMGYGIFNVFTSNNYYSSNMLIRSNAVSSFELKEKLDDFNNYFIQANEFSDSILKMELQMDSAEVSNILGIESYFGIDLNSNDIIDYYDLKDKHNKSDTINIRNDKFLLIKANVKDSRILPKFQEGLINYLNKGPLLRQVNNQRLKNLESLIDGYNTEIMYLDSFQRATYFVKDKPTLTIDKNLVLLGEPRLQLVHKYKYELNEEKIEIINDYVAFKDPVSVINDFSLAVKQESSSFFTILKDIILFLFVGYFITLGWYVLNKTSSKYLSKID